MESSATCFTCHLPIEIQWNFCPNCGNSLRTQELSTSFFKQLTIYLVSFFLPPFGLGYAFQYLKQKDSTAKIVGVIAILLTVISIVSVLLTAKVAADYYAKMLNDISTGHFSY